MSKTIVALSMTAALAVASIVPASAEGGIARIQLAQAPAPQPAQIPPQAPAQQPSAPAVIPQSAQSATAVPDAIGSIASVQGTATVTRGTASSPLKVKDDIFKGDVLQTGANGALGITFDDETTFNLSASARMTVDEFVYQEPNKRNSAIFNLARGTFAFAASQIAKTGDMRIDTPTATLGVRGTSGLIEVPENATAQGGGREVAVKLYQDANGQVGRIEVFALGGAGARLGLLTRAASGFAIRPGAGGRVAAVALQISAQQALRDRGFVRQAFTAQGFGRQFIQQRQQLRLQNLQRLPGGLQNLPGRGLPGQPGAPGGLQQRLQDQRQNLPQQRQNLQQQRQNLLQNRAAPGRALRGAPGPGQPGLQAPSGAAGRILQRLPGAQRLPGLAPQRGGKQPPAKKPNQRQLLQIPR